MELILALLGAWPSIADTIALFKKTPQDKWGDLRAHLAERQSSAMDAALHGAETGDYSDFETIVNGDRK